MHCNGEVFFKTWRRRKTAKYWLKSEKNSQILAKIWRNGQTLVEIWRNGQTVGRLCFCGIESYWPLAVATRAACDWKMDEGWTRQKYLTIGAKISYNWGKNILQLGQEYFTILARISYMWGQCPAIKAQLFFGESKDTLQLKHKTLTMEAKNFFHCSKKNKE